MPGTTFSYLILLPLGSWTWWNWICAPLRVAAPRAQSGPQEPSRQALLIEPGRLVRADAVGQDLGFPGARGCLEALELCQVCWWQDDGQDDRDADVIRRTVNGNLSLSDGRRNYKHYQAADPRFVAHVRTPRQEEL